jgi:penicillin amidase
MRRPLTRFLSGLLALVLVLAILAAAFSVAAIRRSFPKTAGRIRLAGLNAPVDVYRDGFGVPHLYAQTTHDLFFAQGYIHAQDRFWQMDFWRHIGSGRLSEMFGPGQLETDIFLRTLGWARISRQELESMDAPTLALMQAYADGVNAYLADHKGAALSLEYALLGLQNKAYEIEPWEPLHTLTWAKSMAWDLRSNLGDELNRAILLSQLTPGQLAEYYPGYPEENPTIVPADTGSQGAAVSDKRPANSARLPDRASDMLAAVSDSLPYIQAASTGLASLDSLLGPAYEGIGSNNWVIAGERTVTGKPILANDPHLSAQMPSIWYEIGLHCRTVNPDCPYNVAGFSFPGAPAVIIGHNDRIAWGVTNLAADVMDLYIEKINPENTGEYEVNGEWFQMETRQETIQVAGGESVELEVRTTRHGPIISGVFGPVENFQDKAGIELPGSYALALRWTALEPSYLFRAVLNINLARNWDEFRAAARDFSVPAQNLVYADVDGNIGYQMPGLIPVRMGGDGTLPVPGWTGENEWTGYIPFEELPSVFNPPQGYLVTANNRVIGAEYPYWISSDWDYGYRARRIVELIEAAPGPIDLAYIQQMQGDNKSLIAEALLPVLLEVELDDDHLDSRRSIFAGWDYQMDMDSAPAALFAVFWKRLVQRTLQDELPGSYWPNGGSQNMALLERLTRQPDSPWWDNRGTPESEDRDAIFRQAFAGAVAELEALLGADPSHWAWGDLHTVTFINQTLGASGNPYIEGLFNRGPFWTSGGSSIVNATSWDASKPEWSFTVRALPSLRMIVDLGNMESSLAVHTTGQSGHAYHPHYIDQAELWRNIQYHPMLWGQSQVEEAAEGHLRLEP